MPPQKTLGRQTNSTLDDLLSGYKRKTEWNRRTAKLGIGVTRAVVAFSAGTLASADWAQASIQHSDKASNQTVRAIGTKSTIIDLDVNSDGKVDLRFQLGNGGVSFATAEFPDIIIENLDGTRKKTTRKKTTAKKTRMGMILNPSTESGPLANLALGYPVRGGDYFSSTGAGFDVSTDGNFADGTTGNAGFRFLDKDKNVLFGWGEFTFEFTPGSQNGFPSGGFSGAAPSNADTDDVLTLHIGDLFFDDSGAGIPVGNVSIVPEPSSIITWLGLLAMGSVGTYEMRRRKRVLQQSSPEVSR